MGIFFLTFTLWTLLSVFKNTFYQPAPTNLNRIQALESFKCLSGSVGLNFTPSGLTYIDIGNSGVTALKIGTRNTP